MAGGMEAEHDFGTRRTLDAQALGADRHAAVGADLERGADAPNIGPPGAARGGTQDGAFFLLGPFPGALGGSGAVPDGFRARCEDGATRRCAGWRFPFRQCVRWRNRPGVGPARIGVRVRLLLGLMTSSRLCGYDRKVGLTNSDVQNLGKTKKPSVESFYG